MKHFMMVLAALASPAMAQDFSQGSEAKPWNLYAEVPARFEAKVVDILCEMTGDCAAEGDGLFIDDPDLGAKNIYLVQKIRNSGDTEWTAANRWTREWAKANPEAKGKGPWFRRDPRVKAEIAAHGYTGIGAEAEKPFIKEWFE
jgi:hypothetical protein